MMVSIHRINNFVWGQKKKRVTAHDFVADQKPETFLFDLRGFICFQFEL